MSQSEGRGRGDALSHSTPETEVRWIPSSWAFCSTQTLSGLCEPNLMGRATCLLSGLVKCQSPPGHTLPDTSQIMFNQGPPSPPKITMKLTFTVNIYANVPENEALAEIWHF